MSKLRKIRDTVIYKDERYYCGPGPSPVNLGNGEILVAFRRCSSLTAGHHFNPSTQACTVKSYDNGLSWTQKPKFFACGGVVNQNLVLLPDGSIVDVTVRYEILHSPPYDMSFVKGIDKRFVYQGAYGSHFSLGAEAYRSNDKGETWGGPHRTALVPGFEPLLPGASSPTGIRCKGLVLDDGTLVWSLYTLDGPFLMASRDGGTTWKFRAYIVRTDEKHLNEASVYQCPSGKLVAFIRCEAGDGLRYLHTAISEDRGFTWSEPKRENVWGFPYDAIKMPSGNVLLTYGYRREPYGIRARLLSSECDNITEAEEIVLRDDGSGKDLGYPQSTVLSDGTALITYYYRTEGREGTHYTCFIAGTIVAEE